MAVKHDDGCHWDPDHEHCTCGALVIAKAYRFANGNIIAFDQFGHQMPHYQEHGFAYGRIRRDFPHVEINAGEVVR